MTFNKMSSHNRTATTPSLYKLQRHIEYLQNLTEILRKVLPSDENWQAASFESGILCVAVEHHTAASKLRYTQAQYIQQLKTIPELFGIERLRVIIEPKIVPKLLAKNTLPSLSAQTQDLLYDAANLFRDPEITQSLRRLASKK